MLLRALFWITLVAILMPHEPDVGLGRPGDHASLAKDAVNWVQSVQGVHGVAAKLPDVRTVADAADICDAHSQSCGSALGFVDWVQGNVVPALHRVKAQIEEQQQARGTGL